MNEEFDYSEYVPEDLLEEIREYEEINRTKRKRIFPSSRDIVETVKEAALMARGIHPDEFPDIVINLLKEKGYDTRYVTVKRIWRVYENLVRKGIIPDTLRVVTW